MSPKVSPPAPCYIVVQIEVVDSDGYQTYLDAVRPVVADYGYTLLVSSRSEPELLEGSWDPGRVIVMQFENRAVATAMTQDERWKYASRLRHGCTRTNMIMVEGMPI